MSVVAVLLKTRGHHLVTVLLPQHEQTRQRLTQVREVGTRRQRILFCHQPGSRLGRETWGCRHAQPPPVNFWRRGPSSTSPSSPVERPVPLARAEVRRTAHLPFFFFKPKTAYDVPK